MNEQKLRSLEISTINTVVTLSQVLQHYGVFDRFTHGWDSLVGPCPIHKGIDQTQFRISISKNCWYCFGDCQGGGNIIDFVAKMEGIKPIEAVSRMAEWFGLKSDGPSKPPLNIETKTAPASASSSALDGFSEAIGASTASITAPAICDSSVPQTKFPLGRIVATPHALSVIQNGDILRALQRHHIGDWGDVCEEDRQANDYALVEGTRLLSSYRSVGGTKFWIITEWDRSVTTILLPEDY
jgi:hypothetical protein